jgi:radical SAM protein (TIGR01212 family)
MQRIIYRFKDFLRDRFPYPIRKLPIHTNLGCPHRENRRGPGGCIYCYNPGFSNLTPDLPDVSTQMQQGIEKARNSGFNGKFIAYFQTDTNTYTTIDVLEPWWRTIEQFPDDIIGLAIGTRPDCLSQEILALLSEMGRKVMVWLELGLQSAHDRTLELINRGHDYACFVDAVKQVKHFENILICAHIILGLPGESKDDMLHTFAEINRLGLDGVKIHHLQVIKNTVLADWFAQGKVVVFDEQEYIDLLVELLPHLSSKITIHRLVGDIKDELLIAPKWSLPKTRVIQLIEQGLRKKDKYQGIYVPE